MEKTKTKIITECHNCGQRFENWKFASPCCGSLSRIVDENGNVTTRVYLATFVKPKNIKYESQGNN